MKILFEEVRFHVRRQGLHSDQQSYEYLRVARVEPAEISDDEKAVRGSLRNMKDDKKDEFDEVSLVELSSGDWA